MRYDDYGLIVLEQNDEQHPDPTEALNAFHGNRGDSCAETFRHLHLQIYLEDRTKRDAALLAYRQCKTATGYIRHPLCKWREGDFSGDQAKPMYLVLRAMLLGYERTEMEQYFFADSDWGKTGNGDLLSASMKGVIKRANGKQSNFSDFSLYSQIFAMTKIPFRWNDEKWWFESTESSSADWLNWYHGIIQAEMFGHTYMSLKAKNMADPAQVLAKIKSYYAVEKNAFVVELYEQAIKKTWGY